MYKFKMFEIEETTFDTKKNERIKIADWTVIPAGLHNNSIIIQKITPETKNGDTIKKVIKVENSDEFVFKALKTKIKAIGGAEGLVDWMIKDKDLFQCRIINLLNFAWNDMKYYYL